jgi:hypothetical protein
MPARETTQQGTRQAGWYTDPLDGGRIRFWNGQVWTDETATRMELPPPGGPAHPAPTTPGPGTPPATAFESAALGLDPMRGKPGKAGKTRRSKNRGSGSVGLRANLFTSAAAVLGILAAIFMPLYVGVLAIACGALAFVRGERRAVTGLKVAILGMAVGLALAYVSARFGLPF